MAAQNQQYINLDQIIADYLLESEQSIHKQYKVTQLAYRAMDELGLDFFYQIRSLKLPINANYTVNLPPDYLKYTKVGVLNSQGEVIPLTYNTNLTNFADLWANRLQVTQDNTLYQWYQWNAPVFYNYWDGNGYVNLYGLPSGAPFVGDFKIDNANGVILLSEWFYYPYIILEYVATPMAGQAYYVPFQFREAVIAYLWWKDKRAVNVARGQVGVARDLRHEFFNERRLASARWNPISLSEAYNWCLESQRLTIKS
jgi:hypothetical protein